MRHEKGSALITIVLVVFVLTMVGIAGVLYMTVEDRISGNDQILKGALYAAENGLRRGERVITDEAVDQAGLSAMLAYTSSTIPDLTPPGGGYNATILHSATMATDFYKVAVPTPMGVGGALSYSLYVRNNIEDSSKNATVDGDKRINLIAVGEFTTASGRTLQKILEEQMWVGGAGGMGGLQKGVNAGGTGAQGIK
jgi:hypothetical protein